MAVHDTIGDFITVIRNAGSAASTCQYPHSNLRAGIATILRDRGFVEKVSETEAESGIKNIEIHLKYVNGEHAIRGLSRSANPVGGRTVVTATSPESWVDWEYPYLVRRKELWMINLPVKTNSVENCSAVFGKFFCYE